jgi:serine/threonine-protein kinase
MLGKKVGNYVVTSLIDEGGMGKIYLGEHPEIGRKVAIKVISPSLHQAPGVVERFVFEAKAIARINHPNIVQIFDFGRTEDGQLYYTMEILEGRDLEAVIAEQRQMVPMAALPFVEQICAGLQAAHDNDIVHRDLKPANVFLLDQQPLSVKILDFGIAKVLEQQPQKTGLTSTGMIIGSPYTIAPEQAAGRTDQIGPWTDIYSLGVIIYWMLSGGPPFSGDAVAIVLTKHITEEAPALDRVVPGITRHVAAVVEWCMQKDRDRRPASAMQVAQAFARAASAAITKPYGDPTGPMQPQPAASTPTSSPLPVSPEELAETVGQPPPPRSSTAATGGSPAGSGPSQSTTLQAAASEVMPARPGGGLRWWVVGLVGLVAVVGAGVSVGLLWWSPDPTVDPAIDRPLVKEATAVSPEAASPEAASPEAASPEAASTKTASTKTASTKKVAKAAEVTHTITVRADGPTPGMACHVRIDGAVHPSRPVPCSYRVSAGSELDLRVAGAEAQSFARRWTVTKDEIITVVAVDPGAARASRRSRTRRSRTRRMVKREQREQKRQEKQDKQEVEAKKAQRPVTDNVDPWAN